MGFEWDKYASSGGGSFISAAEKQVLAENGIPFKVSAIHEVHKFDKQNFELQVAVPDPETGEDEERVLSFPIGSGAESRDALLDGMRTYFAEGGEPLDIKVEKVGRAFFVRKA
jgi:hypothetical protein